MVLLKIVKTDRNAVFALLSSVLIRLRKSALKEIKKKYKIVGKEK